MRTLALALLAVLLSPLAASQEIYRWVDKDGIVHYSDQPGPGAERVTISGGVAREPAESETPALYQSEPRQAAAPGYHPPLSFNHSQRVLPDSLALYAMFARIDPAASVESISKIIKSVSAQNGNTLELTLDALRTLFQQNYQYGHLDYDAVPTMVGDGATARNDYYTELQSLQTWWEASPFTALNIQPLAAYDGTQIAALAMADTAEGQAYRYALCKLNPFAVTGSTALYDGINAHGELDRYNPVTGSGNLTEQYLKDRAAMLSWKLHFGTNDTPPVGDTFVKPQSGTPFYFEDFTSNAITTKMRIGGGDSVNTVMSRPLGDFSLIVFGSENNDELTGQGKTDRFYGGAGDDTLTGKGGNDHLEGGAGNDTYIINAGDGYDTVLDSDKAPNRPAAHRSRINKIVKPTNLRLTSTACCGSPGLDGCSGYL